MSENGIGQGAFAWSASEAAPPTRAVSGQPRPEAPPAVRGGGARGAAIQRTKRAGQPRPVPAEADPLPPDNELWDVRAAARFLKRSVSWVYHRAEDGTLPVRRLGGWGLRFIPGELRAWVASSDADRGPR